MSQEAPNADQIRKARHAGFLNSTMHIPGDKRKALYAKYKKQDAQREKNITGLVTAIRTAK